MSILFFPKKFIVKVSCPKANHVDLLERSLVVISFIPVYSLGIQLQGFVMRGKYSVTMSIFSRGYLTLIVTVYK